MPPTTPFESGPHDGSAQLPSNGGGAESDPVGSGQAPADEKSSTALRRRRRLILALKIAGFSALGLVVAMLIGAWLTIRHYSANLPSIGDLQGNYNPPQMTRV